MKLLYDLQQEINRLFIAGSKFAKGDPRLQKHIPVLSKLGEKAPVFKKLAADIEDLLATDSQQSSEKLMAISTLLYSVLYTQGELVESDVEESVQVPNIPLDEINTEYSYLQLKPVMHALTTSNSGRLEILKDALERNVFNDSRTYQYLDIALGDKYAELCDYVEKTIIPKVGKPMIPFLQQNFKYEDKTENVRRLRLLNKFGYSRISEMIEIIMASSLPALQAESILIMSENPDNEELIIKLADDKNKVVREAAYQALAKLGTRTSLEKLKDAYINNKNKTNLPLIVSALATSRLPFFFQEVFDKVVQSFESFITLTKDEKDKVLVDSLDKLKTDLSVFENKEKPEVIEFFAKVLKNKEYNNLVSAKKSLLENWAYNLSHSVISAFDTFDKNSVVAFYEKNMNDIPETAWKRPLWSNYFCTAVESGYSKEKIFDLFNHQFKTNTLNINHLYSTYSNDENYYYYTDKEADIHADRIDKRWLDIFYNMFGEKFKWRFEHDLVLRMINACESKSERFDKLLLDLTRKVMPADIAVIFKMLVSRDVKGCYETIYSTIERFSKNTQYYIIARYKNLPIWKKFPKEYAARFRNLATKAKQDVYNEIADEIELI